MLSELRLRRRLARIDLPPTNKDKRHKTNNTQGEVRVVNSMAKGCLEISTPYKLKFPEMLIGLSSFPGTAAHDRGEGLPAESCDIPSAHRGCQQR